MNTENHDLEENEAPPEHGSPRSLPKASIVGAVVLSLCLIGAAVWLLAGSDGPDTDSVKTTTTLVEESTTTAPPATFPEERYTDTDEAIPGLPRPEGETFKVDATGECLEALLPVRKLIAENVSGAGINEEDNNTLNESMGPIFEHCDDDTVTDFNDAELLPWLHYLVESDLPSSEASDEPLEVEFVDAPEGEFDSDAPTQTPEGSDVGDSTESPTNDSADPDTVTTTPADQDPPAATEDLDE